MRPLNNNLRKYVQYITLLQRSVLYDPSILIPNLMDDFY